MKTQVVSIAARVTWRGTLVLALVLGLGLVPAAYAQSGHSTVTLYTRGAPAEAWSAIQWRDGQGGWHEVDGWQGALDAVPGSDVSYKQWGVEPRDYGRGPFRWIVYSSQGGVVWATSPEFYLPAGDGAGLAMTLAPSTAPASAEAAAARAQAGFGYATIRAQAAGAPSDAWVGVQWRDRLGGWHDVEGWQGPMNASSDSGLAFKEWAVYTRDYGRGPFRWVIYTEQGGRVWATSAPFNLPDGDGATLAMNLASSVAPAPASMLAALPARTLPAEASTLPLNCASVDCAQSLITLLVSGAPAASRAGVQWQDNVGTWHDVRGWQGALDSPGSGTPLTQQWTVIPELYGRGPFRWVIYNETGDRIWGVSPSFILPDQGGLNYRLSLSDAG